MLNLIFAIASTLTAAHAAETRVEPLILSLATGEVLVRIHENGTIGLARCAVPNHAVPNLTFSETNALKHCSRSRVTIPDTDAALEAFGDTFESLVRDWTRTAPTRGGVIAKTLINTLAWTGLHATLNFGAVALLSGSATPAEKMFLTKFAAALTGAFGTYVFVDQSIRNGFAARDQAELSAMPSMRGPILLNVSRGTFRNLVGLAGDALARVGGSRDQRD